MGTAAVHEALRGAVDLHCHSGPNPLAREFDHVEAGRDAVRAAVEPGTDLHASADYRRHVVGVLAQRAVADAWRRAGGGTA